MFGDPVLNTKGLPVKKLKQLTLKISSGNTPKGGREVYVSKGITFFRSQNVWRNYFDMSDVAYIDEATHKKMADTSLKHGDLLITKTGRFNTENSSLGRTALFLGEDDSANINGHVYLVRLKPGINKKFVLHILISNQFRDLIRKVCVGGIDKRQLNKNHIEDFPIIIPALAQQEKYADFITQVDKSKFLPAKRLCITPSHLATLDASPLSGGNRRLVILAIVASKLKLLASDSPLKGEMPSNARRRGLNVTFCPNFLTQNTPASAIF